MPGAAALRRLRSTIPRLRRQAGERLLGEERGETLVAFALTASVMFLFLLGLTQMCLAFYTWQWISELAREGTRYAIVRGSTCETAAGASCEASASDIQSYVEGLKFPNIGGGTLVVTASFPSASEAPGSPVEVEVTYNYPYTIPFLPHSTLSMESTSEMTIVQ